MICDCQADSKGVPEACVRLHRHIHQNLPHIHQSSGEGPLHSVNVTRVPVKVQVPLAYGWSLEYAQDLEHLDGKRERAALLLAVYAEEKGGKT